MGLVLLAEALSWVEVEVEEAKKVEGESLMAMLWRVDVG